MFSIICGMTDAQSPRLQSFLRWMDLCGLNVNQVSKASNVAYTTIASFAQGKNRSMSGEIESLIADAFDMSVEDVFANVREGAQFPEVDIENNNRLRAWREANKITEKQLANKIGTTEAVIRVLEAKAGLSSKWLRRLAPALGTTPGYLLDLDPADVPTELLSNWSKVPAEDRPRALQALNLFAKTGTDG